MLYRSHALEGRQHQVKHSMIDYLLIGRIATMAILTGVRESKTVDGRNKLQSLPFRRRMQARSATITAANNAHLPHGLSDQCPASDGLLISDKHLVSGETRH